MDIYVIDQNKKGILLVNKPIGLTSADVVHQIKKKLEIKKIGHCGTLDPLASGMLILTLNKATRISQYLMHQKKHYFAQICFGEQRDTDDAQGTILQTDDKLVTIKEIEKVIPDFIGSIEQRPPRYSAIKINGKRAYDLARKGMVFQLSSRRVMVDSMDVLSFDKNMLEISIVCGHGTYIRSIARDLGQKLDTYAFLQSLIRYGIGDFNLDHPAVISLNKEELRQSSSWSESTKQEIISKIIDLQTALQSYTHIIIKPEYEEKIIQGQPLQKEFVKNPDEVDQKEKKEEFFVLKTTDGRVLGMINHLWKYKGILA